MMKALNILMLTVAAALLLALYIAKTEAGEAQDRLAHLQAELAEERGRINTLSVNVAHLEDPEQLRALARAYLGFEPVRPNQEIELSDLPQIHTEEAAPQLTGAPRAYPSMGLRRTGGGG